MVRAFAALQKRSIEELAAMTALASQAFADGAAHAATCLASQSAVSVCPKHILLCFKQLTLVFFLSAQLGLTQPQASHFALWAHAGVNFVPLLNAFKAAEAILQALAHPRRGAELTAAMAQLETDIASLVVAPVQGLRSFFPL